MTAPQESDKPAKSPDTEREKDVPIEPSRGSGRRTTEELHHVEILDIGATEDKRWNQTSGAAPDKSLPSPPATVPGDDVGRIHAALTELGQAAQKGSEENHTKSIRATLGTMNVSQIEAMARDYEQRYGIALREALLNVPALPGATKQSLEIYLKGSDQRTTDDTIILADIALRQKDLDMFQEAMRDATPIARKRFMQERGKEYIQEAFRELTESTLAIESAEKGSLGAAESHPIDSPEPKRRQKGTGTPGASEAP